MEPDKTIKIKIAGGPTESYTLLDTYKNNYIVQRQDDTIVQVYDPVGKTLFIPALDDSKTSGRRKFEEENNTVQNAKKYIDWVVEARAAKNRTNQMAR